MPLRTINVTRYVTPLREGGSLPAIVEADDDGMYVLKFRGAGQGPKALIAELVSGELARAAGLRVPEIVFANLDAVLARSEPDPEIQELLAASAGLNLALDYLPGSITFDPVVDSVDEALASRIVWFDSFVTNVDRTPRNSNMLIWHKELWLIDHGASLYFQHAWQNWDEAARRPFAQVRDHILLPFADDLERAAIAMRNALSAGAIEQAVSLIPNEWLGETDGDAHRAVYSDFLNARLTASDIFLKEAMNARKALV